MSQKHVFTMEETMRGVMRSGQSRRYIAKVEKQLAKLGYKKEMFGKLIDLLHQPIIAGSVSFLGVHYLSNLKVGETDKPPGPIEAIQETLPEFNLAELALYGPLGLMIKGLFETTKNEKPDQRPQPNGKYPVMALDYGTAIMLKSAILAAMAAPAISGISNLAGLAVARGK